MSLCTTSQLHADAMMRSAEFYDQIREFSTPNLNSLSPGEWLMDACASRENETEHSKSVLAITDSYAFGSRYRLLKYPGAEGPRNADGEEVFAGYLALENKSIIFRNVHGALVPDGNVFVGKREGERYTNEAKPKLKRTVKVQKYRYALVSEDELNMQYERYLQGDATVGTVMESVINYVQRKVQLGTNEHDLRQRGAADDLVSHFWETLTKAVGEKRFRGDANSTFANYVNVAWKNRRNTAYSKLGKSDALFVSSTFVGRDKKDVDGKTTEKIYSIENQYAQSLYKFAHTSIDEADHARKVLAEHMASLSGVKLEIVRDLVAGIGQEETAINFGITRHAVGRVQRKFKKHVLSIGNGLTLAKEA
jgi:hypothetical protein